MIYLYLSITTILSIVIIYDILVDFYEWQSRIHIGRWSNRKIWQSAVEKKAIKWLKHAPTITIRDTNKYYLVDAIFNNNKSNTIQSWQYAGLILALERESISEKISERLNSMIDCNASCDFAFLAYALKKKSLLSKIAEEKTIDYFSKFSKNNNTIPYRNHLPNLRFVDTIGLVCPFLYQFGFYELANRQIAEFDKALLNNALPSHAWDRENNLPLGIYDWGRGLGWYILGLIENNNISNNLDRIVNLSSSLIPFILPSGGISHMFFNKNNSFESSSSAIVGLLFLRAYELTDNIQFLDIAKKIENGLMKATRRNGAIDFSQGDTKGIGFYSSRFSIMPFTQGMSLYFSKELDKYYPS